MTVEEEKTKQQAVSKDVKACDHVGYWVGFGMNILPDLMMNQLYIITSQNCMMCGEVQAKMIPIENPVKLPPQDPQKWPGKNKIIV